MRERVNVEPAGIFPMTEIEERLAASDGAAFQQMLLSELAALRARVDAAAGRPLKRDAEEQLNRLRAAVASAQNVVLSFTLR